MNRPEAYIRRVLWHKDHAQWYWTSWQDETGRDRNPNEVRQFPGRGAGGSRRNVGRAVHFRQVQ